MAENNHGKRNENNSRQASQPESIGNQQKTTQTGAQNSGGENIDQQEDKFTEDLRQSGDRKSSNRNEDRE